MVDIDVGALSATNFGDYRHRYCQRDVALYALSIGCTENDLPLVYESNSNFLTLPTFLCASVVQSSSLVPLAKILPKYDPTQLLHGEVFTEFFTTLPVSGTLLHTPRLINLSDKKAAVVLTAVRTVDDKGADVAYTESTVFVRNAGRFNASRPTVTRHQDAMAQNSPPNRPPDFCASEITMRNAAALYRLSSQDLNPLHIDPKVAASAGFDRPILHGLATIGITVRRLVQEFCCQHSSHAVTDRVDDFVAVDQLRSIKARLAGHVFPGETLLIEAWKQPKLKSSRENERDADSVLRQRIIFRVTTLERSTVVLSHAAIIIGPLVHRQSRL